MSLNVLVSFQHLLVIKHAIIRMLNLSFVAALPITLEYSGTFVGKFKGIMGKTSYNKHAGPNIHFSPLKESVLTS